MAQYIDKDALIAEIRNKVDSYRGDGIISIGVLKQHCEDFIYSLDTLEVKGVDLEKEIGRYLDVNNIEYGFQVKLFDFARHFFELGLKATQKGE